MALIADIDQAQAVAIDLSENRLEQATELIGESTLPGFGHLPQIRRPHAFPPAVEHRDGSRPALLPHPMAKGYKDAIAPHRQGGTKAALGGTGLVEPTQHLLDLGLLSMGAMPARRLPTTLRRELHDHSTP